ncbi:amino acid permease [Candidatus Woesearchaeota archaeon]|nr:amino acid permease [Candidatus Woesearchaeota archaeon]
MGEENSAEPVQDYKKPELKQGMGYLGIIALSLTSMIGTGLFIGPSIAASIAGATSILSWAILCVITIYVAACFGELASMFPSAGGIYEFAKQTYGTFVSFIIGWISWLVANITASVLVVASLTYLVGDPAKFTLFGLNAELSLIIAASFFIIFLNLIAYWGIEASSLTVIVFSIITIGVLLSVIIPGTQTFTTANFTPFFSDGWQITIFVALFFLMETFFGWESATFMAEETKNPTRVIPRALIITTVLTVALTMGFVVTLMGNIHWSELANTTTPLNSMAQIFYSTNIQKALNIGVYLALLGSAMGGIFSSPRLLMALARDKMFIEQAADIHPKYRTPYKAIMLQTLLSILVIFVGVGNYENVLSLLVPLALIMYTSVLFAVTIQRYKNPDRKREYKVWFGKVGPIFISLIYIGIIVFWLLFKEGSIELSGTLLSFVIMGIPVFFLLKLYYDPDSAISVNNIFSPIIPLFEKFTLPRKIKNLIVQITGDIKGKIVIDFGCGVGGLTMFLSEKVGDKGKIIAIDSSKRALLHLSNRIIKKEIQNVQIVNDPHLYSRVHPNIDNADVVFSVGILSYLNDPELILKDIQNVLPRFGKICFIEYTSIFHVIPDKNWLSKPEIIVGLLRKHGFSGHVVKRSGFLWNYLIIYGAKQDPDIPYI